jgi:hypothetical protein
MPGPVGLLRLEIVFLGVEKNSGRCNLHVLAQAKSIERGLKINSWDQELKSAIEHLLSY